MKRYSEQGIGMVCDVLTVLTQVMRAFGIGSGVCGGVRFFSVIPRIALMCALQLVLLVLGIRNRRIIQLYSDLRDFVTICEIQLDIS